jgi:hypothetical protein
MNENYGLLFEISTLLILSLGSSIRDYTLGFTYDMGGRRNIQNWN